MQGCLEPLYKLPACCVTIDRTCFLSWASDPIQHLFMSVKYFDPVPLPVPINLFEVLQFCDEGLMFGQAFSGKKYPRNTPEWCSESIPGRNVIKYFHCSKDRHQGSD
jgi:hypothetical protein